MALVAAVAPVVVFWAAETWLGVRAAVLLSIAWVAAEIGWTRWRGQPVPPALWGVGALVVGLGGLSLLDDDPFWMLWTPVIGDAVVAGGLTVTWWLGRSPLTAAVVAQRADDPPDAVERAFLDRLTWQLAAWMAVHGALTAAAIPYDRSVWTLVSGPGQLAAMAAWGVTAWWQAGRLPPASDG